MGNIPNFLSNDQSFFNIDIENLFNEAYLHDAYRTSPLRNKRTLMIEEFKDFIFSDENFEQFNYLLNTSAPFYKYMHILLERLPNLLSFHELSQMRSEVLTKIGLQTRKELEETV